ncbi:hypothetical protein EJB05_46565, partial [Eragrostis curvula]
MNPSMEDRVKAALQRALAEWEDISRISREWRSRSLEELLPDLSRDEQLRMQNRIRERDRILRGRNKEFAPSSPSSSSSNSNSSSAYEIRRDSDMMHFVLVALNHYNARHPGGEFDPVKPLMQSCVGFRGHIWFHINFWACSRTNSKMIKRFFAEIHHMSHSTFSDKCQDPQKPLALIPVVEICTIIGTYNTCPIFFLETFILFPLF